MLYVRITSWAVSRKKFVHKPGFEPGNCRNSDRNRLATQIIK